MPGAWQPTTDPTPEGVLLDIDDNSEQAMKYKGVWYKATVPLNNMTPANVVAPFRWRTP